MAEHFEKLEETALWKLYMEKVPEKDSSRRIWVREVYDNAAAYLKYVCNTFPNYTLHDERHVLNILYAMGAILGDQAAYLSVGEVELLILAAALHDIGMVYDEAEKETVFNDERQCLHFLRENSPELIGVPYTEWPEHVRQWYLRTLHPFRLPEILYTGEWDSLFRRRPREIVPMQHIIAVCQAHGEDSFAIKNNPLLKYLPAYETEPLFCAMLLRLADLLDFDDTRAPQVLFKYASGSEVSVKEWRKHMASMGFTYAETPSSDELLFAAECEEPGEEYSVREFLDWIDDELIHCNKLQRLCHKEWQQGFPFPRAVSREGITGVGYVSDKFMLTMDQNQILKLLTGENLYESNDIFVRELLQNAVDAVLLRGRMDNHFKVEDARIDLWEWNDKDGNVWFRIDDQGTGMTLGMLKNYFLKVGNSYYTSKELKKDLSSCSSNNEFFGISRFGIGFLSCFLVGVEAEVSTLYFNDHKNKSECEIGTGDRTGYGLRMQITGLSGYYTLRSQADHHIIHTSLPAPAFMKTAAHTNLEYNGYRSKAGTSIVVKLDPGKLGTMDLKASAEKYICGTRMPVFYNGERIGCTYAEIMEKAHQHKGETVYELTDEEKERYDRTFPNVKGQYPKIAVTVVPLDEEEYQILPNLSGILVKYSAHVDSPLQWKVKDQTYKLSMLFSASEKSEYLFIHTENRKDSSPLDHGEFKRLLEVYGEEKVNALKQAMDRFTTCPVLAGQLGDAWLPFAERENIPEIWRIFVDDDQNRVMRIDLSNRFNTALKILTNNRQCHEGACVYQGIFVGDLNLYSGDGSFDCVFFLENELQPIVDVGRTRVSALPLKALLAIAGIISHPSFVDFGKFRFGLSNRAGGIALPEWCRLYDTPLGRWILKTQNQRVLQIWDFLQAPFKLDPFSNKVGCEYSIGDIWYHNGGLGIIDKFIAAYFQDSYNMEIYYEEGQRIAFTKKKDSRADDSFDKFPPMMFCKAGTEKSRRFICCSDSTQRRGITADHPFAQWLLANAVKLESHFPRQFQQIVESLCDSDAQEMIQVVNEFCRQMRQLSNCHGIPLASLQELTEEDFWDPDL